MITIEGLNKTYNTKGGPIHAVRSLSLDIDEGEIFGVIGYSGAGKSTFIRLLNRLEEPTEGRITIDNQEITALEGKQLRQSRQDIGMIFQHFNILWSRTVRENIAFPLEVNKMEKTARNARVTELLGLVGLTDRADRYPSELSGGQKQRVGIARALANDPKVLLCDEATSALDPETTNQILDLLVEINHRLGLTIVLITHEMHVIRKICNRVAVMDDGSIVEMGDVMDVFTKPKKDITRKFIEQVASEREQDSPVDEYSEQFKTGKVMRLHFVGDATNETLISNVCRQFDIDISILQGQISQTQTGPHGTLTIHIDGLKDRVLEAIHYIEENVTGEMLFDAFDLS